MLSSLSALYTFGRLYTILCFSMESFLASVQTPVRTSGHWQRCLAGTFEGVVNLWNSPRTDCPEMLPDVQQATARKFTLGDKELSEFQEEVVQLAAVLNGDHLLNSFPDERMFKRSMKVKQTGNYVEKSMTSFLEASRDALKLGA